MSMQRIIKSALESQVDNGRLNIAAQLASDYSKKRDLEAAGEKAAASFAAEILGLEVEKAGNNGASTARGLKLLTSQNPVYLILMAVAKQDRQQKQDLFWGLDAMRRAAAVEAFKCSTEASTAVEAAKMAAGALGIEPYAGNAESELYSVGLEVIESFMDDSILWEALQLLTAGAGQQTPTLARFWAFDGGEFHQTVCNTWAEVESRLAPKK
jgi:hypothetical protein